MPARVRTQAGGSEPRGALQEGQTGDDLQGGSGFPASSGALVSQSCSRAVQGQLAVAQH